MGIDVSWYDEAQTIVLWTFRGSWRWDDCYTALEHSNQLLEARFPTVVDVIVDLTGSAAVPRGVITHAMSALEARRPNNGLTVIVGTSSMLRILYETFQRIYEASFPNRHSQIYLVPHLDDATAMIQRRRKEEKRTTR